jgi:5'-phosphate synthase pdxT subunit
MDNCNVGVLALQGDFSRHRRSLEQLQVRVTLVRTAVALDTVDALVIPGGESTAMLQLIDPLLFERLRRFVHEQPVLGTCAGAILLAHDVSNPPQRSLDALDISIKRNAYGRQLHSSIRQGDFGGASMEMVFIRAPQIAKVGPGVEVLARLGRTPVLVKQGHIMAATFHPELTDDLRVFQVLLEPFRTDRGAVR